jgi:hypothetical protein
MNQSFVHRYTLNITPPDFRPVASRHHERLRERNIGAVKLSHSPTRHPTIFDESNLRSAFRQAVDILQRNEQHTSCVGIIRFFRERPA